MKALKIDDYFYYFPSECDTIEAFIEYLNKNFNSFICLTQLIETNCVQPYFIEEETETVYINVSHINKVTEAEITVLPGDKYNKLLEKVVEQKCSQCKNYVDEDDLESHAARINLDGECFFFEKAEDE